MPVLGLHQLRKLPSSSPSTSLRLTFPVPTASMLTDLDQAATGLLLQRLLHAPAHLQLAVAADGKKAALRDSMPTHMVTLLLLQAAVAAAALSLPVAVVMEPTETASIFLDQQTHASSVSSSVSPMTQPSNRPVSTSRSTTISQSRPQDTMSQNQSSDSPTHRWMTISFATLSLLTTKSQRQFKSTPSQLSWVDVI